MLSLDSFLSTEDQTRSFQTSVTFREILGGHTKNQQRNQIPGFLTCCPDLLLNQIQASVNWRNELIISTIQTKWKELFCYVGWIFRFERREWRKKKEKKTNSHQLSSLWMYLSCLFFFFLQLCDRTGIFGRHKIGIEKVICCNLMRIIPNMFTTQMLL